VSRATPLVDEIANELDTWPGVQIERRSDGTAVVRYERLELGVLDRERGTATLTFSRVEHDELVEHGDAEAADASPASREVSHHVAGPSRDAGAGVVQPPLPGPARRGRTLQLRGPRLSSAVSRRG
jgi:hypothetical protein